MQKLNLKVVFSLMTGLMLLLLSACQEEKGRISASGHHYILHKKGQGRTAKRGDYVYYHVQMRYQGMVQQNSRTMGNQPYYQIPLMDMGEYEPGSLIAVQEILKELRKGDSVTIDIPVDQISGNILGLESGDTVYYDMVVTDILTQEAFNANRQEAIRRRRLEIQELKARAPEIAAELAQMAQKYRAGSLKDTLLATPSGLEYLVLDQGSGAKADTGAYVSVFYCGALMSNGEVFDNAFEKPSPYNFTVGQARAIKGWEIGLPNFRKGGKGYLFVPADLGYGAEGRGPIPPGADLIFYVELKDVVSLSSRPQKEVN